MKDRIAQNLHSVRSRIEAACGRAGRDPSEVTLVAVTKSMGLPVIETLLDLGITQLGENRAVVGADRIASISRPATWHFIGRLQTNKVRIAVERFTVFHSVDRDDLVDELQKRSNKPVPLFVQVNVSGEASKAGYPPESVGAAIDRIRHGNRLRCVGLMTMAPEGNPQAARPHFRALRALAQRWELKGLSMGMSDDFEVAVEEGATIVRIGSALFDGLPSDAAI